MFFLKDIVAAIRAYDYRDKLITAIAFSGFLLMVVKMIVFPYGLFGFGETNIYTEGLVSAAGIQNINPLFVDYNEADRDISRLVFSGLMKYAPEKEAVVDDMASLTINEEKTEYTFVLRDGLKWHDGEDVTADDVMFTFQDIVMHQSFPNEILKANFGGVELEKVDEKTVLFRLEKPNVFFIANLTIGLLPQHVLEGVDPFDILLHEFNKKPIGTGPYMVTDPVEGFPDGRTQITLERNPYYYSDPSEIELMRFIAYPTIDQLIEEINAVNGVARISGDHILDFENNDRFELVPYELPQYTGVFMNIDSEVFGEDNAVRIGLQKAIDKDVYIGEDLDKIRVDTPLMELDQGEWVYQSSIEQAHGALKEAGYLYDEEDTEKVGVRYNEEGEALELKLIARLYDEGTYQYEETIETVSFLIDSWEVVGVSVLVEFLPDHDFKQSIMRREYDLLLVGHSLGYNLDTYSYWHSTQATPLGQNFSNYKSFATDSLIEDVRSTFDEEEKTEYLTDLANKLKDDVPAIFLYRPVYYYATDGKLGGIDMTGLAFASDRFESVSNWVFQ
jgi:peptide/nickel transport system substrate-binding protein